MGLTQSGPICDVCGKYILGLTEEDVVHSFRLVGQISPEPLLSCYKCRPKVEGDFNVPDLPDGPLKSRLLENAS